MKMTAKRIGSFLLAAAMLLGMVPAVAPSVVPQAAAANVAEYISLPITIRDYADDGMLFDFNEFKAGTGVVGNINVPYRPTLTLQHVNESGRLAGLWTYNGLPSVSYGEHTKDTAATTSLRAYCTYTTNDLSVMLLNYDMTAAMNPYMNRVEDAYFAVVTCKSSATPSFTLTAGGVTYNYTIIGTLASDGLLSDDTGATYDSGFTRYLLQIDTNAPASALVSNFEINTGLKSSGSAITGTSSKEASSFGTGSETTDGVITGGTGLYTSADATTELEVYLNYEKVRKTSSTAASSFGNGETTSGLVTNTTGVYGLVGDQYVELSVYLNYTSTRSEISADPSQHSFSGLGNSTVTNTGVYGKTSDGRYVQLVANRTGFIRYTYSYTLDGATYNGPYYGAETTTANYYYATSDGTAYTGTTYAADYEDVRDYYYRIPGQTTAYTGTLYTGKNGYSNNATFDLMKIEFYSIDEGDAANNRYNATANLYDATGETFIRFTYYGDNINYGFLKVQNNTTWSDLDGSVMDSMLTNNGAESVNGAASVTLSNGAVMSQTTGASRVDLVQPTLVNKELVYQSYTVDYLVHILKNTLWVAETTTDATYGTVRNAAYVMGTKVFDGEKDLATVIREQLTANGTSDGTYDAAKAKYDAGNLSDVSQITSYYDAAYFLLHNTFNDNAGYGVTIPRYTELQLIKNESTGYYEFNSKYTDVNYTGNAIYNTSLTGTTGLFDPIKSEGYGYTGSRYSNLIGINRNEYATYNYNFTLEGHAKFIYYYDKDLYFEFSGDDDVYLFINDQLVLDIGAAHSPSTSRVNINEVAELCGLVDGEAYDFDFYYMERHGKAANFGINTNIQIVDPAMLTQKTGYQNGVEVGYNGYVNPAEPVKYSFQLTNNGEAPLKSLEFIDEDIGVSLSSSAITLNSETTYNDLLVAVYHTDGTYTYYPKGQVTDAILKETLATGLAVGERMIIHGFTYTIPEDKWVTESGSTYFHNTVQTVGVAHYQNATTETLNGVASYRVQMPEYAFDTTHYYAWGKLDTDLSDGTLLAPADDVNNSVTATNAELLALVNSATPAVSPAVTSLSNITITSASGNTANANPRAKVNSDGTITYTATKTGVDNFYFTAKGNNGYTYGPIHVTVFTYGVEDNVYVLDYSLPVELNGTNFGLTTNDIVYVADNPFVDKTDVSISMSDETSNYGTFALSEGTSSMETVLNNQSLKYTMNEFMSGIDSATITIVIKEGDTTDNRTNGVTMTQKLEVVPASVVYYEDDFVDITYVNSKTDDGTGNVWAEYVGENGKGTEQSANQESNYGSDPNYSDDSKWGSLTLDEDQLKSDIMSYMGYASAVWEDLKNANIIPAAVAAKIEAAFAKYMDKLEGTASNGTIHELILSPGTKNTEIMYFDFKGTGFELISRATKDLYAVLTVRVQEGTPNADGTFTVGDANGDGETTSKVVPVITESEGGDVYEVPIIKIDGLPYSNYKVTLSASNVGSANREIYVDGIRIYEPLGNQTATNGNYLEDIYYASDEAGAEFFEIRPLIVSEGQIVYMDIAEESLTFGTGTTVVEDIGDDVTGSNFQIATSDSSDYLNLGPNNEIYLDAPAANAAASILAFYVTKDPDVEDAGRTLQIGVHRKIDGTDVGPVYFVYGSTAADIAKGIIVDGKTVNYLAVSSGTEQYITIDPANLTFDSTGKALVLVGTIGGENPVSNVLALTNIKIAGYAITSAGDDLAAAAASPAMLEENELVQSGLSLRKMMFAAPAPEETIPDETVPDETVPDETVPDETVPDETVPDETVPDVTVPDETVPDETVPDETVPDETAPAEPAPEEPAVNEDLSVVSAEFLKRKVKNGSEATLTVTTSAGAAGLLILDEDGNEISYTVKSCISSENGGILGWFAKLFGGLFGGSSDGGCVYTVTITVEGKPRENKAYQIYAVDENGAISGNSQTASVTIR